MDIHLHRPLLARYAERRAPEFREGQVPGRVDERDPAWSTEPDPHVTTAAALAERLYWREVAERWATGAPFQICTKCKSPAGCGRCIRGFARAYSDSDPRYSREEARERLAGVLAVVAVAEFFAAFLRYAERERIIARLMAGRSDR